jgi:hypothetical protein
MDARLARQEERFTELQRQNQALLAAMQGLRPPPPKQEPPPPPPDFFDNPDAAFEYRLKQAVAPIEQKLVEQHERNSAMMAVRDFGAETVQDAYKALAARVQQVGPQDPTYARIMQAPHPYDELVRWHREQTALTTYGADPKAYIEAEVERRVAERMGQQPQQAAHPSSPQSYPSNMTQGRASVGSRNTPGMNGPLPLSQIMGR